MALRRLRPHVAAVAPPRHLLRLRRAALTRPAQRRRLLSSWLEPHNYQTPPLPPLSSVGLTRTPELEDCLAACRAEVDAIVAHHRATGERFVDRDFDVRRDWRCLWREDPTTMQTPSPRPPPVWRRLSDVHEPSEITLFQDDGYAASGDIVQGQIGTCYLLGSLAAMAHGQKGWVRQLFVAHDAAAGVYSVRFFHWGRWEYVIVDDIIGYHDHDVEPAEPVVDAPLVPRWSGPQTQHGSSIAQKLVATGFTVGGVWLAVSMGGDGVSPAPTSPACRPRAGRNKCLCKCRRRRTPRSRPSPASTFR